jgi:predicted transglutaminase-like cysteine proteinase
MHGFRTIILTLVLGSLLTASHPGWAKVSNQYPFDAAEDYLAPAAAFPTWATTLELHATQRATLQDCTSGDASCRGRLRSYGHTLVKSKDLSDEEQISLVHYYINRSRYDDDHIKRIFDHSGRKVGIQRNHWTTLYDFLRQGGDCEDFATSKYFMLRELGFAADDLRIVIAYERKLRGYHAVLAVRRPNEDIWLLDSDNMIRKKSHRGYRYIYAMNETSVWDHRPDYNSNETLDNSTEPLDETTKEVSSLE